MINLKISTKNIWEIMLSFFAVYIFAIHNIFVINIVFVLFLLTTILLRGKLVRLVLGNTSWIYYAYICWIIVDVLLVEITRNYGIGTRNLVQLIYELQYFFLLIDTDLDINSITDWIVRIATIYSIIVIALFFCTGTFLRIADLYGVAREWGEAFFPGGTTSAPIPFILSLFIAFKKNCSLWQRILITIGGLLFPSRVSLLGMVIIWMWFTYEQMSGTFKVLSIFSLAILILCGSGLFEALANKLPALTHRLTVSWDRMEIMSVVLDCFKKHPILGYGGKTLGQFWTQENLTTASGVAWAHTHNFLLELIIRYGLPGCLFFLSLMIALFRRIKSTDYKFIFLLMIFMALFQTYLKEFYYLFYIILFIKMSKCSESGEKEIQDGSL